MKEKKVKKSLISNIFDGIRTAPFIMVGATIGLITGLKAIETINNLNEKIYD